MSNSDIIYVDGSFDLLHSGHINFFKKIKKENDYLIVGVTSDKNIETYKRQPILSLDDRVDMLEHINLVDKVISDCPFQNISEDFLDQHKITKIYYAGDENNWREHYKVAIDKGIMHYINYSFDNLSTTKIINKIRNRTFDSEVLCDKVYVKHTPEKGYAVFARMNISKGELVEKGLMIRIDIDGNQNPYVFNWSDDRKTWGYGSGCVTFYNTSRDSNTIMTRYFEEDKYEIHAKKDIQKDEELTHTYRSLEWRDAFDELRKIKDL